MRKSKSHTTQRQDAVKYGRVSSKEQEKEGFSIPAQFRLIDQHAQSQGLKIVREFVDVETAKKPGRAGFEEMIKFLKRSSVRVLLVEKTDRLYQQQSSKEQAQKQPLTIISDRLDRTATHCLIILRLLLVTLRLLVYKRIAVLVRAHEVERRSIAANVTIDARRVHVI